MDTAHYGEYFSNINIEYYIPIIEVYMLMGKTDILNKGYINSEDMRLALEYIINNYNEDRIMQKMESKQRIRRKFKRIRNYEKRKWTFDRITRINRKIF